MCKLILEVDCIYSAVLHDIVSNMKERWALLYPNWLVDWIEENISQHWAHKSSPSVALTKKVWDINCWKMFSKKSKTSLQLKLNLNFFIQKHCSSNLCWLIHIFRHFYSNDIHVLTSVWRIKKKMSAVKCHKHTEDLFSLLSQTTLVWSIKH